MFNTTKTLFKDVLCALAYLFLAAGCNNQQVDVSAPPSIKGTEQVISLAETEVGSLPAGWSVQRTGKGKGSKWQIVADETAPSGMGKTLAQISESPRSMFNLCVLDEGNHSDLKVSVALKAVAGKVDQGGGLVWRYVDANNYYVCRFNPLENNLRIYKVIAGRREQLASTPVKVTANQWYTLTATMKGNLMVCTLGDAQVAARDNTLQDAGRIGLWTKADAETRFDQIVVVAENPGSSTADNQ